MTLTLTVAHGLAPLADRLAEELAIAPDDPFAPELVAIPGDGVRTWLAARLSQRLGIVANIEFVFPGQLVRRALGEDAAARGWGIGPLTWAIHEVMRRHGPTLGLPVDAVRARTIADLFDRYALHRSEMVRRWELGIDQDVNGDPLPAHLAWQPALWRHVGAVLGIPSDATSLARAVDELRNRRRTPAVPERVFVLGLASLPAPQMDVLAALATQRSVHVLAPSPSMDLWQRLRPVSRTGLPRPCPRAVDPSAGLPRHRLLATWGRQAREAQVLLLDAAQDGASISTIGEQPVTGPIAARRSLLAHLQDGIVGDAEPPGPAADGAFDFRFALEPDDHSMQWHRCHGLGRQVEVLRDVIVHLLESTPDDGVPFELRDIAILCPDVVAAAPLAEAVFAGDPERGVPALPLRIADRSLRQDNPVLDAVGALLELVDGRFRASDVLAFAARPPVRRRFGLHPDQLGQLALWAEQLHVRWGLDAASREEFGVPRRIAAHTWEAGLDQLLLGAVMADAGDRIGLGGVVPFGDIEGDEVTLAGTLAELLHELTVAHAALSADQPVAPWCDAVRAAALALCSVPDADSWQWRDLETELTTMSADADLAGRSTAPAAPASPVAPAVPAGELAALLGARLVGRPGRVRFGTGAITLSSLTAQRGVPHRVVCLLGMDGDLGGGGAIGADDLAVSPPCVGDRDGRSETRAQLLDALLAATDRFVVCSAGRDVRSNAMLPPAVPLAELADLIDAAALPTWLQHGRPLRASAAIAVDHPRQAWSEANFVAGALGVDGPLSFDRGARDAAVHRRGQGARVGFLDGALPPELRGDVRLDDLVTAVCNPVRALLQLRLGLWLERGGDERDDLVPLQLDALDAWRLKDQLVDARLAAGIEWSPADGDRWALVQQARGAIPPLSFGAAAVAKAEAEVAALFDAGRAAAGEIPGLVADVVPIEIELAGGRWLRGEVEGVRGHVVVEITPTTLKPKHQLAAWIRLAALWCARPDVAWEYLLVGRNSASGGGPHAIHLTMRSPQAAREVLELADDLLARSRSSVVPALAGTTYGWHHGGRAAAAKAWTGQPNVEERSDVWVRFALGEVDLDDILDIAPAADEVGAAWGDAPSRVERWAHRIWGAFEVTTTKAGDAS